ncbi:glycine cleavage system aminomethyltransferase GcvT [Methylomarinum sp. Ch1-1]|uniref:aminomethyltransferase n=1 Tax=Methylomarinum roseum TaxID=3067653 RepID=A0AAU7NRF2_9GAMM|nr:glycine cleavage system aminomethyltransferase GcvT [Methylomarinum sp. Ch1-1]MDP4520487.1 glycine cleavage system aminomethyltransferase GcvT [Methylomarinum sp. Ch1-1]
MADLKQTALYDLHRDLDAKMVSFANYSMPLHYANGIIAEHRHCRSHAGFFDISHMGQCLITVDDAATALEKLLPSIIGTLPSGKQRYTVLTNHEGGIIDDIIVSRLDQDYMLVVNAGCKDKDYAHLQQHLGRHFRSRPDQALFALQGPAAQQVMQQLAPSACRLKFMQLCRTSIHDIPCLISRSGYTGEDGFEISVANESALELAKLILSFEPVQPIGLGARDSLRLEAGLSLYGHELDESISPVEAGLSWVIDKQKRQFLGADIIHRQLQQGAPRKRVGLLIEGKIPVREHSEIHNDSGQKVGYVTSGGFSPTLKQPIALALIDRRFDQQSCYALVRNRQISMRVTTLPFVPHHYHRG